MLLVSADVQAAFEQVRHQDITDGLLDVGVHPEFVAAYLQELAQVHATIKLGGGKTSAAFAYENGGRRWEEWTGRTSSTPSRRWP